MSDVVSNLGSANTGLAGTVGYKIGVANGTLGALVKSGITEPIAGTGTYLATGVSVPSGGFIVWYTDGTGTTPQAIDGWAVVNFGPTNAGLASPGYQLASPGAALGSRVTTGKTEIGNGMYQFSGIPTSTIGTIWFTPNTNSPPLPEYAYEFPARVPLASQVETGVIFGPDANGATSGTGGGVPSNDGEFVRLNPNPQDGTEVAASTSYGQTMHQYLNGS